MNKLLDFGRKALFYVRVLSGYEERRIRSSRLQLEKRVQQAQERRAAINNVPEQIILSEVRRMVEEMQALNKKMEETEAAIEEYFKPIDKEAEIIMKMQLEGEEKTLKQMMKAMQEQALLEKAEVEKIASMHQVDKSQTNQKEAEIMMKMQLGGEDKTLKEMMQKTLQVCIATRTQHRQLLPNEVEIIDNFETSVITDFEIVKCVSAWILKCVKILYMI